MAFFRRFHYPSFLAIFSGCATGAICPVGHYCMAGFCAKDFLSQTSSKPSLLDV
jgi:hypothetical protein